MSVQVDVPFHQIVAFLADPTSYAHRPDSVDIVETHASVVALAGPYVFKVKKPVDFGFLNYSTLSRRRHFCEREVELNRRLCPDVYLGVLPIIRRDGNLQFAMSDAADSAVDYAVQMYRLDEPHFLSAMLDRGQVTEHDLCRLVDTLVPFYRRLAPATLRGAGSPERIRETVLGNLDLCTTAAAALPHSGYAAVRRFSEHFLVSRADLFRRRIEKGWIKDGHGDLRPEHIHLAPDRVRIYDCIEFNDALRFIDVAADVAFLSMELAYAGRWTLSNFFLVRIAEMLGDDDMHRLINFYHAYRAAVRAKVAFLLAKDTRSQTVQREQCTAKATRYFQLALHFALVGSTPTALVVMGPIATGKSTLASALGEALGWPVFSSDRVRKELAGLPHHHRPDAQVRQRMYAEPMSQQTYKRLIDLAIHEVGTHNGAIIDATFGRRVYRVQLSIALRALGAQVRFLELIASDEVIRTRLRQRERDPHSISDARLEDFDRLRGRYEPPYEQRPDQLVRLDSAASEDEALKRALSCLVDLNVANASL